MRIILSRRAQIYENVAYNERLIKCEHNDELDGQEFSQGTPPSEFMAREVIKYNQAIEGKARLVRFVRQLSEQRRAGK
jgi:hypothetical protein